MSLVHAASLAATVDAVGEALFFDLSTTKSDRIEAARWIAARQGLPRAYAGMFAPTDADFRNGLRLFTGETITTRAGVGHMLGEEACRALLLLGGRDAAVRGALDRATASILARLNADGGPHRGTYCCGRCSVSLWRHLAAGGVDRAERRLAEGLAILKARRLDGGRWRTFPFDYTLLALAEIDLPQAIEEMRHAAPVLERRLRRTGKPDRFSRRRRALAERVLARC
jgi:hypothetical protein